jgi:hypothetical protein
MKSAPNGVHVMRSNEVQITGDGRESASADEENRLESVCHAASVVSTA